MIPLLISYLTICLFIVTMAKTWIFTYCLQINYYVNWVDGNYYGKLINGMELYEIEICYPIVQTLLKDYKLKNDSAITYVQPNVDPQTNVEVICSEENIKMIYDK